MTCIGVQLHEFWPRYIFITTTIIKTVLFPQHFQTCCSTSFWPLWFLIKKSMLEILCFSKEMLHHCFLILPDFKILPLVFIFQQFDYEMSSMNLSLSSLDYFSFLTLCLFFSPKLEFFNLIISCMFSTLHFFSSFFCSMIFVLIKLFNNFDIVTQASQALFIFFPLSFSLWCLDCILSSSIFK